MTINKEKRKNINMETAKQDTKKQYTTKDVVHALEGMPEKEREFLYGTFKISTLQETINDDDEILEEYIQKLEITAAECSKCALALRQFIWRIRTPMSSTDESMR